MKPRDTQQDDLRKTLARFADVLAAMGALFLAPYVISNFRAPMEAYLRDGFPEILASLGAWGFVALVIAGTFFGGSMLLQMLIYALYRFATTRGSYH